MFTATEHEIQRGTTYKVSMQAIDKAGNTQEATNKDTEAFIKLEPQTLPEMIANGYIKKQETI